MALHVLEHRGLADVTDLEVDDGRVKALVLEHQQQPGVVERERTRLAVASVEDGRHLVRTTQAAARTLALGVTELGIEFECGLHDQFSSRLGFGAAPRPGSRLHVRAAGPRDPPALNRCRASSRSPRRGCGAWSPPAAPQRTAAGSCGTRAPLRAAESCPSPPAGRAPNPRSARPPDRTARGA